MNGLGKLFRKKSDPKNRKNSKNQSEIAACEQKSTTEKPNLCLKVSLFEREVSQISQKIKITRKNKNRSTKSEKT